MLSASERRPQSGIVGVCSSRQSDSLIIKVADKKNPTALINLLIHIAALSVRRVRTD